GNPGPTIRFPGGYSGSDPGVKINMLVASVFLSKIVRADSHIATGPFPLPTRFPAHRSGVVSLSLSLRLRLRLGMYIKAWGIFGGCIYLDRCCRELGGSSSILQRKYRVFFSRKFVCLN